MKKKIAVGSYKTLSTDILPGNNILNMDINSICLLVGKNGTGKTLILVLSWLVNYITASWVETKGNIPLEKYADFLFQKSFDRCDWTGFVEAKYENLTVRIELDRGNVVKVTFTPNDPNVEFISAGLPVFMSKETRLFTQINQYLKLKKMMNLGAASTFTEQNLKDLTEMWRIYDIFFIERMVARISDPNFKVKPEIWDNLNKSFFEDDKKLVHISYDEIGCNFIIHEEKKDKTISKYHATMLSAGEQSLVNMIINSAM